MNVFLSLRLLIHFYANWKSCQGFSGSFPALKEKKFFAKESNNKSSRFGHKIRTI